MRSSGWSYLLAALGLVTPVAGIHRFYLGRPVTGFLYLMTWGFFGVGTIVDLFRIPHMVDVENMRRLPPGRLVHTAALGPGPPPLALALPEAAKNKLTPEQRILHLAGEHDGAVTVAMVAMKTGMSLRQAKKELERLRKQEFCTIDVSAAGARLYVFEGLRTTKPLDLE
ncbi:MAG TPA: TM2 domain-containing protein [Kofleriaceae bacterium]|jgi:hypothetical protein|nr:TM2 domain-containing protein [Kofleriaceae bacterium]